MLEATITATFLELVQASSQPFDDRVAQFFDLEEELTFEVVRPAESSTNPGVLVYISPKEGARMPAAWAEVLERYNLVWVGAQNSGNEVHVARRVGLAMLAPAVAGMQQSVDGSRVYLSGFSGGGRVASMMMPAYPERFAGAVFICGANPLFDATPEESENLKERPMVFLTGTGDFNLDDTRMAISTYEACSVELMVVDGLDHALPEAPDLDQAINFLERAAI